MPKSKNKKAGGGADAPDKADDAAAEGSPAKGRDDDPRASSAGDDDAAAADAADDGIDGPAKRRGAAGPGSAAAEGASDAEGTPTGDAGGGGGSEGSADATTGGDDGGGNGGSGEGEEEDERRPTSSSPSKSKDTSDAKHSSENNEGLKGTGSVDGAGANDDGASPKDGGSGDGAEDDPGRTPPSKGPTAKDPSPPSSKPRRPQPAAKDASGDADAFDDDYSDARDTLLTMAFNQDGGCLAVGTGTGFRICNAHPFQETFRRALGGSDDGGAEGGAGIAHIEMLYRTNLLALTGHASSPRYPPNKVLIYDDHLQRTIGELSFRQKVLATKLRRDRIVVVLRDRVYIYNFSDLALLDKVHTGDNPLGLIGISMDNGGVGGSTTSVERAEDVLGTSSGTQQRNNGMVLACPSTQRGQVRVELYGLRRTTLVDAHESALGALALSVDGSLLATASERGTVIRLYDTRGVTIGGGSNNVGDANRETASVSSSAPLREFRRGVERATISCLTFSLDSRWLGCASNHGTVHVFETQDADGDAAAARRRRSSAGRAMRLLPKLVTAPRKYLVDGVQSCAQVRGVPRPRACAFVPDRERTIAVAGMDEYGNGCLLLAEFGARPVGSKDGDGALGDGKPDADSTEARRLGYHRFFKCKSPSSQSGGSRRRTKTKEKNVDDTSAEGGAYIDDAPVDMRMNHISIGDENEDDFVPIDYEK